MNVTQYPLYTARASQQIDAAAIAGNPETSFELMQRAADFCLRCIQARWPTANHVHLYCGNGHNGGDGFLLAAGLIRLGKTVTLEQVSDSALSDAVTERAWQVWQAVDAQQEDRTPSYDTADLLVDAMLGTGLTRDVGWRLSTRGGADQCQRYSGICRGRTHRCGCESWSHLGLRGTG